MSRKVFCLFLFLFVFSAISSLVHAENQTVFGPRVFEIGQWHVHFSVHTFDVENPGEGIIRITKNTPEEQIRGGFIFFNTTFVPLRGFLVGDDLVYEKEITLRSGNYLTVFLRGTPGASINIEVNKAGSPVPPPEVTFSADPQIITTGESSTLTWATTYADSVSIDQGIGSVDLNGSLEVSPTETTTYTLTAVGTGGTTTESVTVTVNIPPPTVTISADPETIVVGESATLNWASTNADSASVDNGIGTVDVNGSTTVSPTETITYTITVTGPGGTATESVTINVTDPPAPPTVSISATPARIEQGASSTLTWTSTNAESAYIDNGIGVVSVDGSTTVSPAHTTTYIITLTGPTGSASAQAVIMVTGNPEPQPEGSFGEQYEDLIPPDATVEEYDPKRFSVITGLVNAIDDSPISDVYITVQGHPEYGTAFTDAEGRFSIPVEGGSIVTVVYQKQGLIPAQRKVYVPWNDIAITETIQMISEDPITTTFTFDGNPDTVVTHQSTVVTDEFGSRSCTMVFTGDNRAYLVDENGNDVRELTTITTRASEYTTPESMPAKLPPTSAYTYCTELSVDGIQRVRFDKPVTTWIDNFLGFDVGEIAPVGYYDRDRGVWVPSDNGVVIKLLDTDTDGIVDALDADGDDQPDDLNENDTFSDEVTGLSDAGRYPPGSTFWKVEVTHFSPCDMNWPLGPTRNAIFPNPEGVPDADEQEPNPCNRHTGSFTEERSRVFHENILIPGTDMTLHYASNRVEGYKYGISVPASGDTVPDSLIRIIVRVQVAGTTFEQVFPPLPRQKAEFTWDGLDYLGRRANGRTTAHVSVGFAYDGLYYVPDFIVLLAFGQPGETSTSIRTRKEVTKWKRNEIIVDRMPNATVGAVFGDGWTLSPHHYLNSMDLSTLHKGDGTITKHGALIIDTVAGSGAHGYSGDEGPAIEAQLNYPHGAAFDAEGNLYIADNENHRVRKVDTNGIITTVAGNGTQGYGGDGGPATEANLYWPVDIAVDAYGNLYIADGGNSVIRKVDTDGIITTVAGLPGGDGFSNGDGGPAIEAYMNGAWSVAVDAFGDLYIGEYWENRIRKVCTSGIIETIVGNGTWGYSGDGGQAREAQLSNPIDVAVDISGNLYIAEEQNHVIRKMDASGLITTMAGNGTAGYSGDLGPAAQAQLNYPGSIALDAVGNLYIADHENRRIRKVDDSGIIKTIAGNGTLGYSGDDGPATQAEISHLTYLAVDAVGDLYIADGGNHRIRNVSPISAFASAVAAGEIVFAEERGIGHIMSNSGRHKKTIDLDTGVTLYEFGYNEDNRLVSITDRFGNQTTVERDGNGVPTSITSPDGVTPTLIIDANSHLTRITYPDSSYYSFEYTSDGLMTAKTEPEGNRFEHVFDSLGRLTDATDQEEGHWQFSRTAYESGDILTDVLTGEGNLTSYLDHTYSTGAYTSTITDPTGTETLFSQSADGLAVNKSLPCGMEFEFKYGVDSEYKFKYIKEMMESTPSAIEKITLREKTYQDTDSDDIPDLINDTVTVNGNTTTLENDVLQSRKTITSPEGRTVSTFYDSNNLMTTNLTIPGLHETTYGYDTRGRLTSISTNTRGTAFTYNAQGFLESITDSENQTTTYSYDPVGRMTEINRPDGSSIGFTYDDNGNMTMLTNPSAIDHGLGYNAVNLNSYYQTPLSGSYSYLYDKDRRLTQINFPSTMQIRNIYDKTRLVQIQTPEGNIDLSYLCATKVGSITKGTESITYGYDGYLLTSETLSGTLNQSLSYAYNNDFNVQGFTYAGNTHMYTYDDDGLLTGAGGFTMFHNAGNGLPEAVTGGTLNLSRTFNSYGEVAGQDFTISGQNLTSWNLTRDDNGRITGKAETIDGTTSNYTYTYDSMGRLLSVTKDSTLVEEYEYGPNGTRTYEMNSLRGITRRNFTYSDEDYLLTAGATTYEFDFDGFMTRKASGTDVTEYDYSTRGELLSVTLPDGSVIEHVHDPLGRRIAKKVGGVIVEKYLWQGLTRLLAVYDGSDNLLMRFEYTDGRMPVAMTKQGSTYYLTYDQVGSLRIVADASGNVVKLIDYDSFGNIINDTDPAFEIPLGFAGGLQDRDTGLVRFGYRDYDPDIGRWTTKDPVLFAGGDTDLYGYCLNDPINWMDPLGLFEASDVGTVAVSVATTAAKVGGFITGGTAIAIGAAATVVGVLIPSELADEDRIIEHERTMKEIEELNKRISDVQKWLEPMLDKLNIPYDYDDSDSNDDDPC